jgi:hypothetical protein
MRFTVKMGRSIAQAVGLRFPNAAARVKPRSGHMGFVVDKVALGQVFSEYCGFPCQFEFHGFINNQNKKRNSVA